MRINVSKPNNWHSSHLICKGSVSDNNQDLGYSKVRLRCVPLNLTVEHKTNRKSICSKLLACFEAVGETCLPSVVTADENWVHHSGNKEAIHMTALFSIYLAEIILKCLHQQIRSCSLSSGTITERFFWIKTLKGEIINSDHYITMLTELRKHFKTVWPHKKRTETLLLYCNAMMHTSLQTGEAITISAWAVLPHPQSSTP